MNNELSQQGLGLIGLQNIKGPEINITQILGKSYQYKDLLDQLNTQQKLFNLTPQDEAEERLKISGKINELKSLIEQFKQDVLSLAATFEKIEINTERLKRAKEFFDKGELGEARAVLEIELEQMRDEQKHLLARRDEFETEILPKLQNNSEEFYVLAMATQVNFDNPNRFAEVCDYFERSIQSYPAINNFFEYALFLQKHNQLKQAEQYYNQYLDKFSKELSHNEVATILNNLGVLHFNQNEFKKAEEEFQKSLAIYRNLAKDNPQIYLTDVALILDNLGALHRNQNEFKKAAEEFQESLDIYRSLAKENPQTYLPELAITLSSLGDFHRHLMEYEKAEEELQESLTIYRSLAKDNLKSYMRELARALNNLGVLYKVQNEFEKAEEKYMEALELRRQLARDNPQAFSTDFAQTCYNLALFYEKSMSERERAVGFMIEAVKILLPIAENIPFIQKYLLIALAVLQDWGLSEEEIEQRVKEKIKPESE